MNSNILVVFDLDFTLWDAGGTWCDHTDPPYKLMDGYIEDHQRRIIYLFPDVIDILSTLKELEIKMAVASRTHNPGIARKLMELFSLRSFFNYEEIYPGSKVQHFEKLHHDSGVSYSNMYFFDDEQRNVIEVEKLGVNAELVPTGLDWHNFRKYPELTAR